jgi:Pilus formation protein N terminal region
MGEVVATEVRRTAQFAAVLIVAGAMVSAASAETIIVTMDQAKLAHVPARTATLVVGNPLIADVSVQAGGTMVITGKGYGVTNVIALDPNGRQLFDKLVRVKGPAENVIVYRGMTRESYICEPNCERRITLGDTPDYFDTNINQTSVRNNRAMSGQAPPPGAR